MNVPILVLAAGASTRMGRPKQLLPFAGTTLLGHVLEAALAAELGPVIPVLGANAGSIGEQIRDQSGLYPVYNPDWSRGLGSSIRSGMEALQDIMPAADAVLILLGDQPRIGTVLLREFAALAVTHSGCIIAASYSGTTGVPALFPRACFDQLMSLDPGKGAKPLLEQMRELVVPLPIDRNPDLDTMEEYRLEMQHWKC